MANNLYAIPIALDNDAIAKEFGRCINCKECLRVCKDEVTVARMYELDSGIKPICINCGQCANICPTESLHEKFEYLEVEKLLKNKNGKKIAFSIAPAVRVALGEEFDIDAKNVQGKIVSALKLLGADYVFDITFGADLTIMEEAMELVNRIKNNGVLPMFTSCCPAWVKYVEIFYPEILPNLSTCKSPISMQSSILKNYFAKKAKIKAEDFIHIVVAPCTAKKSEINRSELNTTKKDTNYCLTTRELALLFKQNNIDFNRLLEGEFDSPLSSGSSAGLLFGNSGGVLEAALRTANFYLTGKNLGKNSIVFNSVRGMDDIKEADVKIGGVKLKVAVANGMKNAKILLDKILKQNEHYDFVEVMNCKGGCIAGGGQPKLTMLEMNNKKEKRMQLVYNEDKTSKLRFCHENPEIKEVYEKFLNSPNSKKSEQLLHTKYFDKSYLLKGGKNE